MGAAVGGILSEAIGVAISPIPIIAVILLLSTPKARLDGITFVVGWMTGLLLLASIVMWGAGGAHEPGSTRALATIILQFSMATLFFWLAWREWSKRGEEPPAMPGWMKALDVFGPGKSFLIGATLAAVNLKNTPLTIAAMASLAQVGVGRTEAIGAIVVFVVVAALGVGVPVIVYVAGGTRAQSTLAGWRTWLERNNSTVMLVLWLVLGFKILGSALGGT